MKIFEAIFIFFAFIKIHANTKATKSKSELWRPIIQPNPGTCCLPTLIEISQEEDSELKILAHFKWENFDSKNSWCSPFSTNEIVLMSADEDLVRLGFANYLQNRNVILFDNQEIHQHPWIVLRNEETGDICSIETQKLSVAFDWSQSKSWSFERKEKFTKKKIEDEIDWWSYLNIFDIVIGIFDL